MNDPRTYKLAALTDLWTGDRSGKGDRLIPTGLLGSIRWWFEVLVRGLGGSACDPTKHACDAGHHCVVCELFGCTGWARKFRFDVLDAEGHTQQKQIKKDDTFQLVFTPLRPIRAEEWALLDATIRLVAEYGAIGGKTVYKPSDELSLADASIGSFAPDLVLKTGVKGLPLREKDRVARVDGQKVASVETLKAVLSSRPAGEPVEIVVERNGAPHVIDGWIGKRHHRDYGIVAIEEPASVEAVPREQMERYVRDGCWRPVQHGAFAWASLENFWCVKGRHLARQGPKKSTFNRVLGRREDKSIEPRPGRRVVRRSDDLVRKNDAASKWLAGGRGESKKVFSFKDPERTFGFIKPGQVTLEDIRNRLEAAWGGGTVTDQVLVTGTGILEKLLIPGKTE